MVHLSKNALEGLKEYAYVSSSHTLLDRLLIWDPIATRLPESLAPNALTIVSSFLLGVPTIILCYISGVNLLVRPDSSWLALATAGFYCYILLDVLDGKQARKLNVASPLGQLLDHGLDGSINSISVSIIVIIMLGITDPLRAIIILTSIQTLLFFATITEKHIGELKTQTLGIGVEEMLHLIIVFLLITLVKGYGVWDIIAIGGLTCRDLLVWLTIFM